jgi:pimeloyl-ACP methyl ester carboxylesterase
MLLHGLMGRASHWAGTARWLAERHRAVALDQRGHGRSANPTDSPSTRETWVHDAHWDELAQVTCPTLVVRGLDGALGRAEAQEMVRVLPQGQYAEVTDAGHLVHYDQPGAWQAAVQPFLDGLPEG